MRPRLLVLSVLAAAVWAQEQDSFDNKAGYPDDPEAAATRLWGYTGCDRQQGNGIYAGWKSSWKVMDLLASQDVNWEEAAAMEYLAPPGLNKDHRTIMQRMLKNLATIQGRMIPLPLDWRIHVRCDDPNQLCTCGGTRIWAYTTNRDSDSGLARINFCPRYFDAPELDNVVNHGKGEPDPKFKYNMERYSSNKAHIWLHELLHIDWVSTDRVTDHRVSFRRHSDGFVATYKAYGPQMTKILARAQDPGYLVRTNADNMALYALSKYVGDQIGAYPHYPLVNNVPWEPGSEPAPGAMFLRAPDGKVTLNGDPVGEIPADCQTTEGEIPAPVEISAFSDDSNYPEAYLSERAKWAKEAGVGGGGKPPLKCYYLSPENVRPEDGDKCKCYYEGHEDGHVLWPSKGDVNALCDYKEPPPDHPEPKLP